ncbi:MAG: hypothetical protein ACXV1K_04530, partial [Kineosporiaceae bacterium]
MPTKSRSSGRSYSVPRARRARVRRVGDEGQHERHHRRRAREHGGQQPGVAHHPVHAAQSHRVGRQQPGGAETDQLQDDDRDPVSGIEGGHGGGARGLVRQGQDGLARQKQDDERQRE